MAKKKRKGMSMNIKQRLFWSFMILVILFVIGAGMTVFTVNQNEKLSARLTNVVEPSLETIETFKRMMLESKMYSTNWVFLRYKQEDKDMLERLHQVDYAQLKLNINKYTSQWTNHEQADSMARITKGFEELLAIEKKLMNSLKTFTDYDDPVIKLEAERLVEDEILPRTAALVSSLNKVHEYGVDLRTAENEKVDKRSARLRMFIIILSLTIVLGGLFLARYMTDTIVRPINQIRSMVNDLGKGILRKVNRNDNGDEISKMILSVNNLSDSLQATATFAHQIGKRNFDIPFKPLSNEDTLGKALLAMRDNLRTSERDLEIQNRELEIKNKELEQFAYVASHDLQEPLRTTSGFVDLLQQQYKGKLDDKADKYLSYIIQSSDRMRILISDLLEYSRIGSKPALEKVDCSNVLNDVITDLGKGISETGAVVEADPLPVLYGYPTELKLLFQNLVFNAIKFRRKDVPPRIKVSAEKKNNAWQFSITDNGIGIAREHNERIFIIFQRLHTRSQYKGSGIGLSHCKKIVELHKGKIWLDSQLGKGSTFHFTIQQHLNK